MCKSLHQLLKEGNSSTDWAILFFFLIKVVGSYIWSAAHSCCSSVLDFQESHRGMGFRKNEAGKKDANYMDTYMMAEEHTKPYKLLTIYDLWKKW